mgnify:CR=1 FL=1
MRIDGPGFIPEYGPRAPVSRAEPRPEARQQPADLKAMLSADELSYFAELERMGPLTYGRRGAKVDSTPPAALGQRIDIRA